MKFEIEITEEELRSAIERKVRAAVADQSNTRMRGSTPRETE